MAEDEFDDDHSVPSAPKACCDTVDTNIQAPAFTSRNVVDGDEHKSRGRITVEKLPLIGQNIASNIKGLFQEAEPRISRSRVALCP